MDTSMGDTNRSPTPTVLQGVETAEVDVVADDVDSYAVKKPTFLNNIAIISSLESTTVKGHNNEETENENNLIEICDDETDVNLCKEGFAIVADNTDATINSVELTTAKGDNADMENNDLIKIYDDDTDENLCAEDLPNVEENKDSVIGDKLYIENLLNQDDCLNEVDFPVTSGLRKRKNISVADYTRSIDPNSSPARDTYSKQKKIKNILKSLSEEDGIVTLRQLAISRGGLLNDDLRKKAWPLLLNVDLSVASEKPEKEVLHSHRDYEQVVMDVNRSLKRFPPGMEQEVRLSMQDQLVDCIMRVLVTQKELHYYQGYHDIVVTFLLVVGEDITVALMQQLSMKHLRDFMYENMDKTSSMLHYLYPLIGRCSQKLRKFMESAEVGTMFCLPWLITWFGHVLNDIKHIVRLYDFFIACHPLMPIYLAAAIVQYRGNEILQCEPEMPFIHCLLSNIPDDLPFEQLILEAGDLYVQYPPDELANEAKEQHEKYLEENRKKQEQLNHLKSIRAQRQNQSSLWPFKWGKHKSHHISTNAQPAKTSTLVKMTVWTGAAVISAVAVTFVNAYYFNLKSIDSWVDIHWLWGSK